jgi:transcriptional regulator with XRE-family HTH domain
MKPATRDWPAAFAVRLAAARTHAGLTQRDLAAAVGVTSLSVSRWERADRMPDAERLARICAALEVDPAALLAV